MDEIEVLYEKILDNQNWEMDDLDRLLELVRLEGYTCGKCATKEKAIDALDEVLERWVHGAKASNVIETFKKIERNGTISMEKSVIKREVDIHELAELANTLRMVANALGSPKRESCLDRNIMRSWNYVVDVINGHEATAGEMIEYYTKVGQTPDNKERT